VYTKNTDNMQYYWNKGSRRIMRKDNALYTRLYMWFLYFIQIIEPTLVSFLT